MAVQRTITGTVADAQGTNIASGWIKIKPIAPLTDTTTFVSPEEVTVTVTNGAFTLVLYAPMVYDFLILDQFEETIWNFQAPLDDDSSDDISLAELYLASQDGEELDITTIITRFVELVDTPSLADFVGKAGSYLVVNATEDGIDIE